MKLASLLATIRRVGQWPTLVFAITLVYSTAGAVFLCAAEASDSAAMCRIFGEETLAENHAALLSKSRQASKQHAYDLLSNWVLPGRGHGIRVQGEIRRYSNRYDSTGVRLPEVPSPEVTGTVLPDLADYRESGWIRSPVRELIRLAQETNCLSDLRQKVTDHQPETGNEAARKSAVLTLIEVASGRVDEVAARLEERYSATRQRNAPEARQQHWLDLLVLWSIAENPSTVHLLTPDLFGVYTDWSYSDDPQLDVVLDYLKLLHGRCREFDFADQIRPTKNVDRNHWEKQWMWFSRSDSSTHAHARPLTRYVAKPAGIFKVSGHELDYLLYRTPIAGPVDVHCEFASQFSAFTELMLHGTAVFPREDGQQMLLGGFAKGQQPIDIAATLEARSGVSESQAAVRDGHIAYSFNGRELFRRPLKTPSAPWLGLRSWRRTPSDIRSVQVNHARTLVSPIRLLGEAVLRGWASYYHAELGSGLGNWTRRVGEDGSVLLSNDRSDAAMGSFDESLLRYAVPIRWDAEISYDFFFRDCHDLVHPSFGRRALMLDRSGVTIHWLTDGRHDNSLLRPDNARRPAGSSAANASGLSLQQGWNSAKLRVEGDQLILLVNGQQALKTRIEETDSRFFGLFHYRDQTSARVRNIQLSGHWHDQPPPVESQVLAPELATRLDESANQLPTAFEHDFGKGLPTKWFSINGDEQLISRQDDGVRMTRVSGGGVESISLSAMFDGDFDIIASYKDLAIPTGDIVWHCGFGLAINLENLTRDRCAINRRRDRMHGQQCVAVGRKEVTAGGKFAWTGGTGVVGESTSGSLRLARRGNTLYALHATSDGRTFRLIDQSDLPPGPIAPNGIKLVADVAKGQQVSITWTNLTVKAEQVNLLDVKDNKRTVQMLNQRRRNLASQSFDFAQTSFEEGGFSVNSSAVGEIVPTDQGVVTNVLGTTSSRRLSVSKSLQLGEEFDIQVDFKSLQMDPDKRGRIGGENVLQVLFTPPVALGNEPDEKSLQISEATLILRRRSETTIDLRPRIVGRGRADKTVFLPLRTLFTEQVDQLRIAQTEGTLYFLVSQDGGDETHVVATYPLDEPLTPAWFCFWSIASPGGGVTKTIWKQLRVDGITATAPF